MADPPRHPVMLDLAGRRCVVVGGGAVAWRKVQALREAGARVTVIAPRLDDRLAAEVADGGITWDERSVDAADLPAIEQLVTGDGNGAGDRGHGDRGHGHGDDPDGVGDGGSSRPWLVVAATDDRGLNRAIADTGTRHGTWVTDATDPGGGPASSAAIHRAGPVTVAVSTAGVSPSAAAWLRDELAAAVDPAVVTALELLAEVQAEASAGAETASSTESAGHGSPPGGRGGGRAVSGHVGGRIGRSDWRSLLDSGMLDDIREGHRAKAKERLQACLSSSSD